MRLIYRRAPELVYSKITHARGEAWHDADARGGYRRAHTADTWVWQYEPELKRENYLRAVARTCRRFGSARWQSTYGDDRCPSAI